MSKSKDQGSTCIAESEATFYVALDGNDSWSGKLAQPNTQATDGPFCTLLRARNAVREVKDSGVKGPFSVIVRGGKYFLDKTLLLGPKDSGSRGCPIIYTAYPGEEPILSGGVKVSGWKPYKGNIFQAEVPWVRRRTCRVPRIRQLFCNGVRQRRARYPKFDPDNPLYGGWAFVDDPVEEDNRRILKYKKGTFRQRWAKPSEGEVNLCNAGWCNIVLPIKEVDYDERTITMWREMMVLDRPPWYFEWGPYFARGTRYYVENILEELDTPGEWCIDHEDGIVYFWPAVDDIEKAEVVIPTLDCLLDLNRISHITVSGFKFTETSSGDDYHHVGVEGTGPMKYQGGREYVGDALHLNRSNHCIIEKNHFDAVGGNAIYLDSQNERNLISRNEISYAGANGVCLVGSTSQFPIFNHVEDNHIHHCGMLNNYVAGVFLGLSDANVIAHNYIHHTPSHAINLGVNGLGRNIVEYNELRFTTEYAFDSAAINAWGDVPENHIKVDTMRSGHIIRYNLIVDTIGCRVTEDDQIVAPETGGTKGIYLDDCASNCMVYQNIVLRAGQGLVNHLAQHNLIEHNMFIDCKIAILFCDGVTSRIGCWDMAGFMKGNWFTGNIFYSSDEEGLLYSMAKNSWSDLAATIDNNILFHKTGKKFLIDARESKVLGEKLVPVAEWQALGHDQNSVFEDPKFVDLENENFQLEADSPALAKGFPQIDVSKIGIRPQE